MSAPDVTRPVAVATPDDVAVRTSWVRRNTGWTLAAPMALLYAVFALVRHAHFLSAGYDLGLNDQIVSSYARFQAPYAPIAGPHYNMLGDHFSPVLALLAPLYWIWADPRMLLLAQSVLVALSVVPVHRMATRQLGRRYGTWIAVGYALGWPLQAMVGSQVHEVMFAVPLIAVALDALDRRADRTLLVCCLALVFVKEDMGLVVLMFGVVRFLVGGADNRRRGLGIAAIGLVGYLLAAVVVIPLLSPGGGVTHWTYDALGPDLPSALGSILLHPLHALGLFAWSPPVKAATLFALLAERFFSSIAMLWGPFFHYSSTVWPILLLAAVDGARRMRDRSQPGMPRALTIAVVASAVVGTLGVGSVYPFQTLVTGSAFHGSARLDDQRAIIAAIPANTCVEADDLLVPHLLHTNLVSEPGHLGSRPDFVAIDRDRSQTGYNSPPPSEVETGLRSAGYTVVMSRGDVVLFRSPDYAGPSAGCRA